MIRRIITALCLCLMLFCVVSLCACDGNSQSVDGAMTPVKDSSGNITGYERKYHNDNGDVTRWDIYDANQEYQSFVIYEYDDGNRLTKEAYYRADGIGEYYYSYVYDDDGDLYEKGYFSSTEGATRTLFDKDGKEIERYIYDETDALSKHEVMENGKWTEAPIEEETNAATE